MNAPITIRPLRGGEPLEFVLGVLETGGAGEQELNASELRSGLFRAFLPADTAAYRAMQFAEGGLLPSEPGRAIDGYKVQAVPTTIPFVAGYLAGRIGMLEDPALWVHEPVLSEQELGSLLAAEMNPLTVRCQTIRKQPYLVYESGIRDKTAIAEAIGFSLQSWHLLAFVTDRVHQVSSVSQLVQQARMILAGAYDGESVLIWERQP